VERLARAIEFNGAVLRANSVRATDLGGECQAAFGAGAEWFAGLSAVESKPLGSCAMARCDHRPGRQVCVRVRIR